MTTATNFKRFADFYPYYLSEHSNLTCRRLHYLGTTLVLALLAACVLSGAYAWLWLLPVVGYVPAWLGHFVFEKNRPATFRYPFYSLMGDFVMYAQMLGGRIKV